RAATARAGLGLRAHRPTGTAGARRLLLVGLVPARARDRCRAGGDRGGHRRAPRALERERVARPHPGDGGIPRAVRLFLDDVPHPLAASRGRDGASRRGPTCGRACAYRRARCDRVGPHGTAADRNARPDPPAFPRGSSALRARDRDADASGPLDGRDQATQYHSAYIAGKAALIAAATAPYARPAQPRPTRARTMI